MRYDDCNRNDLAWFKRAVFQVTARGLTVPRRARLAPWWRGKPVSVPLEPIIAQHLQPVRERLPRENLGRRSPRTLGTLAPHQPAVVEEKLKQGQVVGSQLAAEEKVASQPAVEILHQGAGPNGLFTHLADRLADFPEPTPQFLTQSCFLGPATA